MGLTVVLAFIAALSIGRLYGARQDYEDVLARSYELEAASARLLAAGVLDEAALHERGRGATEARRTAAQTFAAQAAQALVLAEGDDESVRLVRARIAAQQRAQRLSRGARRSPARERQLAGALLSARGTSDDLATRQVERRAGARDRAESHSRNALIVAALAGGLALLGALGLIAALIGSIRRPLDDLVGATRRFASGELEERVDPAGPEELRDLGGAFNRMASQLGAAQQRIEEERERLAVTIESLGDALVVCDSGGVVTAVNPRAETVVPALRPGVRADEQGSPLPALEEALGAEVMREEGERTLSITAARLGNGDGHGDPGGVVWTIRDVSERARLERMKSDFVATASHELRSPLTSIKGFVELLSRSEGLAPREKEFVGVILESTDRLVDLVNDLLDVARLEAGRMEVHTRLFDLAEIVRESARLIERRLSDKSQQLELNLPHDLPRVLADPGRVRQIVNNLLSNAHEYTDTGGHIAVSLSADEGYVALTVTDNGRGMSAEEVERIFDRFVRREDGTGGTGLGLSIVKSLVDLQRGKIAVDSTRGKGSTFTVRLPSEAASQRAPQPRTAIRGKRVLVVDDERDTADLIAAQLSEFEVDCVIANSGDEALERLKQDRFDAMTLDILMPGRSGFDVLRHLRADPDLRRTPVVVVSVFSGSEALFGEWKVSKPIDADQLADALGSALLAGRTDVLVVGRSSLRPELEPTLTRMGLDHVWVTSGTAAGQACRERRFEIALVDAGMRSPQAVLRSLDLRGRRQARAVVLFSTGEDVPGVANLGDTVPLSDAASAVLELLGDTAP